MHTHKKPVFVFQSTDKGAPQLANAKGSLKTVLKACLVNGYGNQAALDWKCLYENGHLCAFQSKDNSSNGYWLRVDNQAFSRAAILRPYTQMRDLNNTEGYFGASNNYDRFGYIASTAPRWWLIGHSKAFIFIVSDQTSRSQMFYFGDVPSLLPNNTIFLSTNGNYDYLTATNNLVYSDNRGATGIGTGKWAFAWNQTTNGADLLLHSMGYLHESYKPEFPDRVSGGFVASETYLMENDSNKYYLRGLLAGVLSVQNDCRALFEGQKFSLNGEDFLKFSFANNYGFLVNVSSWEA